MQKSELFAYLAAFVSIVLAVALTTWSRARIGWSATGRGSGGIPLTPIFAVSIFLGLLGHFAFGAWYIDALPEAW